MPHSLPNSSKIGFAQDDIRKPSSKSLKSKRSIIKNRKGNTTIKDQDRLVGGADAPEEVADVLSVEKEITEEKSLDIKSENEKSGKFVPSSGPCCVCSPQPPGSTGDRKVDEIINLVHQNLQEAGKALVTLSENFEHDLKLMFIDILGRIQQWTGLVQNKLDLCKEDIESLRKELIARECEIANLRKLLADCEEREKNQALAQQEVKQHVEEGVVTEKVQQVEEVAHTDEVVDDISKEEFIHQAKDQDTSTEMKKETIEIVCVDAAIQSMMKDKERMRREIELEAEIARLKRENECIVKERAEYENAIQRALLRGVSSLNVEALRVLRCPPIPCCTPCAPCPSSSTEPIVPCKREGTSGGTHKGCVSQRSGTAKSTREGSHLLKRPCASPCCPGGKGRKPTADNSMVFLLHQGDTGNVCVSNDAPVPRVCGTPMMKKLEIPPCPRFSR